MGAPISGTPIYGGQMGAPMYGAPMMAPSAPATTPESKKTGVMVPAPATIVVTLPADARLLVDDAVTASTSAKRVFVSPALIPGKDYHYTLKAEFVRDGKPVVVTREVAVRAGNETRITIDADAPATVASR